MHFYNTFTAELIFRELRATLQILFFGLLIAYLAIISIDGFSSNQSINQANETIVTLPEGLAFSAEKEIILIINDFFGDDLINIEKVDKKEQRALLRGTIELDEQTLIKGLQDFLIVSHKREKTITALSALLNKKSPQITIEDISSTYTLENAPLTYSKGIFAIILSIMAMFIAIYHKQNPQQRGIQLIAGSTQNEIAKSIFSEYLNKGMKIGGVALVFFLFYRIIGSTSAIMDNINELLIGAISLICAAIAVSLIIGMIERNKFFNQLNNQ